MVGILGLECCKSLRIARLSKRAASLGHGQQHLLVGRENLGSLGHKVYASKEDDGSINIACLNRERQRVTQKVGYGLHLRGGVVVSQDDSVLLSF